MTGVESLTAVALVMGVAVAAMWDLAGRAATAMTSRLHPGGDR